MSRGDSPLDRILHSLSHPVRRRILRSLADQPGSASSLAAEFGMQLSPVSYHLNRVLAEDCNVVDLVKMIPRRGSVEKLYVLNRKVWAGGSSGGTSTRADKGPLRALAPGECFLEAVEALDSDTFAKLKGSAWEWFPVAVDAKGWKEIQRAREEFNKQLEDAVRDSEERATGTRLKAHDIVVGSAAFPAAHTE